MKRILGLDLGTNSIGWALVNEAENENEKSSITKLGVRVNPLTVDEQTNFEKGKSITTNADRTLKRAARRNLQRYKLRKENLIEILKANRFITNETILSENGNKTTFETYRLRAKAASEEVSLEQLARILLMINAKRGYKSSRKAKSQDEGQLIDGMGIAKKLYEESITPSQLVYQILKEGKKFIPDFYRSDLQAEYDKIWDFQKQFHSEILTDEFKKQIAGKGKVNTTKIFLAKYGIYTADNKSTDKRLQAYKWRVDGLSKELSKEELAFVISDLTGTISNSSGYLGAISDRSKELYFNKQTIGQYLMAQLDENPNTKLKNQVFYRQDYLDEFNTIWETQAKYHKVLTAELKGEIRDIVIFYQRRLKSQKGLISICEFESKQIEVEIEGIKKKKTIGSKVCPKSSPLFQEFKIWQVLNNLQVIDKSGAKQSLEQDEKEILFAELSIKDKLSKTDALKLLYKNYRELDLNFKDIEGNRTQATLFKAYQRIIELSGHGEYDFTKLPSEESKEIVSSVFNGLGYNTDILSFNSNLEGKAFENQPLYLFWHLLYSFEGDDSTSGNEKLLNKISELYGFGREYAKILANINFEPDYGSLSTKAIRKILPYLKDGNEFSLACAYAGYKHSKDSLTKEELENKILKNKLDILPKNSLRNPVVEKILNQMINVVNTTIDVYGKPDEIRIELARELKKSAKEREDTTKSINDATAEHEKHRITLRKDFGLTNVSRNDIIRYKLYLELKDNGFHTLYSDTYISPTKLFSKEFDIEHIIPQSRLFDDSFSNKTLEKREANIEKANDTAYDYISKKTNEVGLSDYLKRIENLYKAGNISKSKYNKLKMKGEDIPSDFINRDLRDTQYIAKKAKSILEELVKDVVSTSGSITDRLRQDWQLVDVMQELNWEKYDKLGLTEIIENREGHKVYRIKDWTKRNDHRHHAMDALTIAFTKRSHIQYLNNLNARSDKGGSIYGIETKELYRDDKGKLKFKAPIPLKEFRAEAKKHLENTLISIKAKNKVATININTTDKKNGVNKKKQLTPRGQLHLETVYGRVEWSRIKLSDKLSKIEIEAIKDIDLKQFIQNYIKANGSIKNAFSKEKLPLLKYKNKNITEITVSIPCYTQRIDIQKYFTDNKKSVNARESALESIYDLKIREVLMNRYLVNGKDFKKAFSNLDDDPIWLNETAGIRIKSVTITGISNAVALHEKKDKEGKLILNKNGNPQPVDFVNTGNNHHVAIYMDENANLQENVVSFFEATTRINQGLSIIDKEYKSQDGWKFLFSMKQNEYFVFPNEETGFNPNEIDLLDAENYKLISPNLFRVQTMSKVAYGNSVVRDYKFRHHLETTIKDSQELKEITYKQFKTLTFATGVVKVRINHIGQIVSTGEY